MYTLDTNAIIYYLDRDPAVVALLDHLLEHVDTTFFVSTVTELELYSYPDLNDEEEAGITRLLTDMFVVPLDSRLARSAGSLRRVYRLKTPDGGHCRDRTADQDHPADPQCGRLRQIAPLKGQEI